jgi:hypothetical protein
MSFRIRHLLKYINVDLAAFLRVWPTATPTEIYLGFGDCHDSMRALIRRVRLPAFREKLHRDACRALGPATDFVWSPLPLMAPRADASALTLAIWLVWPDVQRRAYIAARRGQPRHYFRHLPQGEIARTGDWSDDERRLFLERLREVRDGDDAAASRWGIFSLAIPGRDGRQCLAFHRQLVARDGEGAEQRRARQEGTSGAGMAVSETVQRETQ